MLCQHSQDWGRHTHCEQQLLQQVDACHLQLSQQSKGIRARYNMPSLQSQHSSYNREYSVLTFSWASMVAWVLRPSWSLLTAGPGRDNWPVLCWRMEHTTGSRRRLPLADTAVRRTDTKAMATWYRQPVLFLRLWVTFMASLMAWHIFALN